MGAGGLRIDDSARLRLSNGTLELLILGALWVGVWVAGPKADVAGSGWTARDVLILQTLSSIVRRTYNAHLEHLYFAYPEKRTQNEKKRPADRDVTGRTAAELALIEWHDCCTMLAKFVLDYAAYYCLPQLYPTTTVLAASKTFWWLDCCSSASRLLAHHYALSFGMYWAHRNLHVNKFLWDRIHSLHHYAKTPLARTTYMDHWLDNIINAVISEVLTQLLVPLPRNVLYGSRLFRICESLEKHSGVSGNLNVAHAAQRALLPCAQMPHHHDWHHEGHKGSNYTFASCGGLWDVLFGTRHFGRADRAASVAATSRDKQQMEAAKKPRPKQVFDHPLVCPLPLLAFVALSCKAGLAS